MSSIPKSLGITGFKAFTFSSKREFSLPALLIRLISSSSPERKASLLHNCWLAFHHFRYISLHQQIYALSILLAAVFQEHCRVWSYKEYLLSLFS